MQAVRLRGVQIVLPVMFRSIATPPTPIPAFAPVFAFNPRPCLQPTFLFWHPRSDIPVLVLTSPVLVQMYPVPVPTIPRSSSGVRPILNPAFCRRDQRSLNFKARMMFRRHTTSWPEWGFRIIHLSVTNLDTSRMPGKHPAACFEHFAANLIWPLGEYTMKIYCCLIALLNIIKLICDVS